MAEKKLLSLSAWPKGMVRVTSRTEIPEDALWLAENVRLDTPGRVALRPQDAMVGTNGTNAPVPNHNTAANTTFSWLWNSTSAVLGDRFKVIDFYGGQLLLKISGTTLTYARKNSATWNAFSTAIADAQTIGEAYGKRLLVDATAGYIVVQDIELANPYTYDFMTGGFYELTTEYVPSAVADLVWIDTGAGTYQAYTCLKTNVAQIGGSVYTALLPDSTAPYADTDYWNWTGAADAAYRAANPVYNQQVTWRAGVSTVFKIDNIAGVNTYQCYVCLKAHTNPTSSSDPLYLPDYATWLADPDHPTREYWGHVFTTHGIALALAWGAHYGGTFGTEAVAYVSGTGSLLITSKAANLNANYPAAVVAEWMAPAGSADGSKYDLGNPGTWPAIPINSSTYDILYQMRGGGASGYPYYPAHSYGASQSRLGGDEYFVNIARYGGDVPADGDRTSDSNSPGIAIPEWTVGRRVTYYAVDEYLHGGFSRPKLISASAWNGEVVVAGPENEDTYISVQVWAEALASEYKGGIKKTHLFRCNALGQDDEYPEVLIGTVNWESAQIFAWDADGNKRGVIVPTKVSASIDLGDFNADSRKLRYDAMHYMQDRVPFAAATYQTRDTSLRTYLLAQAFQNLLDDQGIDLAPALKPQTGIHTFVDYGQDPAGETAETILGATIADLLKPGTSPANLDLVGMAMGRAFYTTTSGNNALVYYSDVDQPGQVGKLNYLLFKDSGPAVGVADANGYLIVFFDQKSIVIDARSGFDVGWGIVGEYLGSGLASKNTLAIYQNRVLWAGSGGVWTWDGTSAPVKISEAIDYPEWGLDMKISATEMWGAVDPVEGDYLLYMKESTSYSNMGQALHNSVNASSSEARVLVYNIPTGIWTTETLRQSPDWSVVNTRTAGIPFVLDNFLVIPMGVTTHSGYYYFGVRGAYQRFLAGVSHDTSLSLFKLAQIETGLLHLGAPDLVKRVKRFLAHFGGKLEGYLAVATAAESHWLAKIFAQDYGAAMPAPWTALSAGTAKYTKDFRTAGGSDFTNSIFELKTPDLHGHYVGFALTGGEWLGSGYWTEAALVELTNLGLVYQLGRTP